MRIYSTQDQSRGVALVVALVILVVFSILLIALFADVQTEVKMSGMERNSERALKLAEAGVQIARATFLQDELYANLTSTRELASVDGFMQGGYFFTSLGSGLPGNEKWVQWHYDASISGNNTQSEVTTPLKRVWATAAKGQNGEWISSSEYNVANLYAIVAGGAYFQLQQGSDFLVRAHDEYTGARKVRDYQNSVVWEDDKYLKNTTLNKDFAKLMSPIASYSNLSTIPNKENPAVTQQTLYFTYAGGGPSTGKDTTSTVRLRAGNALCNPATQTELKTLWEFDTGIHGIGTAPAFFDPSPGSPGDEIIYFAVVESEGVSVDGTTLATFPDDVKDGNEQIYLFAVVDTSGSVSCSDTGSYRLKWSHPFPDPYVNNWTDYPTEQATGTDGFEPPYVRKASDMTPLLPEDDVLFDYRDGIVNSGTDDYQRNQIRGDLYQNFFPQSVSPPILNVFYQLNDGTLTTEFAKTLGGNGVPEDPVIDIYLMFAAHPRVVKTTSRHTYDMTYSVSYGNIETDWQGTPQNKKRSSLQTQIIAIRDRLAGSYDAGLNTFTWNWNSARSRFPTFKWSYRVPGWDPVEDDQRPWNGYGEFTWESWFEQQVAPMINVANRNQDGSAWDSLKDTADRATSGGTRNLYTVLYPAVESIGYAERTGSGNNVDPPETDDGAPVDFGSDVWDDSHLVITAIRDTWDDYMDGNQTNPLYQDMVDAANSYAMPVKSNPVEPYWTHKQDGVVVATDGSDLNKLYPNSTEQLITYPQYGTDTNKYRTGFSRPYTWWEARFDDRIKGTHPGRDFDSQGWDGYNRTSAKSRDMEIEGETSAFCRDCLNGDGLIVQVFNHDIKDTKELEDLRAHGINARTGAHVWDFHMPAKWLGDYYNGTPAIANDLVFIGYQLPNELSGERKSILQVLEADTGESKQKMIIDADSDALIMSPTIANGAVYIGTYDFNGNTGNLNMGDDIIRIFALSPVIRLVSIGIYPADSDTLLKLQSDETGANDRMPRAERKLQVWFTGGGSKWEEIRETYVSK